MAEEKRMRGIGTMESDTIAAIATSVGEAGIGIVRLSGPEAFSIAETVFLPVNGRGYRPSDNRKLRYGHIRDGAEVIDEVLVSFMKGPHTYTAEDVVEINAHGGIVSVRKILALALRCGARMAERGEFTRRAFLNGRMDLAQAEAVLDVIDARTAAGHAQAVQQLTGALSGRIGSLKEETLELLAQIEYAINFMEDAQEDLPRLPMQEQAQSLLAHMDAMLASSRQGRLLREGIQTVIVGAPNVGKSSLLNALLQESRAIVTDVPGTTRDTIEESFDLDGILLQLVDTAGLRETDDLVEALGVDRSRARFETADLVLVMLDGAKEPTTEERAFLAEAAERPSLILMNKSDQPRHEAVESLRIHYAQTHPDLPWLSISATQGTGIEALKDAIREQFFQGAISSDESAVLSNLRHIALLQNAREEVASVLAALEAGIALDALEVDLRSAYHHLCEITGEMSDEDVLDRIFQNFCVGK